MATEYNSPEKKLSVYIFRGWVLQQENRGNG